MVAWTATFTMMRDIDGKINEFNVSVEESTALSADLVAPTQIVLSSSRGMDLIHITGFGRIILG